MGVRQINRSSFTTHQPKVDTGSSPAERSGGVAGDRKMAHRPPSESAGAAAPTRDEVLGASHGGSGPARAVFRGARDRQGQPLLRPGDGSRGRAFEPTEAGDRDGLRICSPRLCHRRAHRRTLQVGRGAVEGEEGLLVRIRPRGPHSCSVHEPGAAQVETNTTSSTPRCPARKTFVAGGCGPV